MNGAGGRRARLRAKARGAVRRQTFSARHLVNRYRTVGGHLGYDASDLFAFDLPERKALFRKAFQYLAFNGIPGDYAEFGSFGAQTFRLAWGATRLSSFEGHLWAFDSFEGLPVTDDPRDRHPRWTDSWLAMSLDEFHEACAGAGIPRDRYTTVVGRYADSLRDAGPGRTLPDQVCFAYVDCDLYSSTTDVLPFLEERLVPSAVIAFDDWFCYSPTGPSGERLAALEHFADSAWALVPFVQYGWHGMSFLVEDSKKVPPSVGPW